MSLYDPRINVYYQVLYLADVCAAAKKTFFSCPGPGKLSKAAFVIDAAPSADTTAMTVKVGDTVLDHLNFDVVTTTPALESICKYQTGGDNAVKIGDVISLNSDGAGTGTVNVTVTLFFEGDA